jgi:hypothetical protein
MIAQPTLPLRVPATKITLPLSPGLFLATTPIVSLLIRQANLLTSVARLTILIAISTALLVRQPLWLVIPLSFPLATVIARLKFLGSPLFFGDAALLIILPPLTFQAPLFILILWFIQTTPGFVLSLLLL